MLRNVLQWGSDALKRLFSSAEDPAREINRRRGRNHDGAADDDEGDDAVDEKREKKKRKLKKKPEELLGDLTRGQKNSITYSQYQYAKGELRYKNRERFSEDEREELLAKLRQMTGASIPTWRSLKDRIALIEDNGGMDRKPGSGRSSLWPQDIEDEAKTSLRARGGEISKLEVFEEVIGVKRPGFMGRSTWYRHMANRKKFKTRRLRMKPHLSPTQMQDRVQYADYILGLDEQTRQQIVYVDEKWFEAFVSSNATLPAGDKTPEKFGISKTNQPKVMTLVCLMEPRGGFSGIVGQHLFISLVKTERNSKNREAGVMEFKTVNVTAAEYLRAWKESLLPRLKELQDQKVIKSSLACPLWLQDDNARPHRACIGGVLVSKLICDYALTKFKLHMKPLDPSQPAQSPDCNPLDTFFFRVMYKYYRQARAEDRVNRALQEGRRRIVENVGVGSEESGEDVGDVDEGADDDFHLARVKKRVPLRCKPSSDPQNPKCPHCKKVVKDNVEATQCDFRGSWWHNSCANSCLEAFRNEMGGRGADPSTVAPEESWWCPQCAYHLCRNEDAKKNLCVICEKPSARHDRPGTDMVTCDSAFGGLFHKSCVGYDADDLDDDDEDDWLCPVCDVHLDDRVGADELAQIDEVPLSDNTLEGIAAAIRDACQKVDRKQLEDGFETRLAFLRAIRDAKGTNSYEKHWRPHKKRGK